MHAPLLCAANVFKIASGTLSLPGKMTPAGQCGRFKCRSADCHRQTDVSSPLQAMKRRESHDPR